MSAHNHDEEIIKQFNRTKVAKKLDKKIAMSYEQKARDVINSNFDKAMKMPKDEAVNFLLNAIDESFNKENS
jgi:hypothetical protein